MRASKVCVTVRMYRVRQPERPVRAYYQVMLRRGVRIRMFPLKEIVYFFLFINDACPVTGR
jgi:hypothetical protein